MGLPSSRRQRLLAFAACAALVALLGLPATPAAAETTLEVTTTADGHYQPGRRTPLVVTIEADRAVAGTLTATFEGFPAGSQRVEVPGGSAKQVVFTVMIPPWSGSGSVVFTGDDPGDNARTAVNLLPAGGDELVAVLPELAERDLPATAGLETDIGVARLIPLDVDLLDSGSEVLGPFTQLLATADDLRGLEGPRLDAIDSWVASEGGLLLVDDEAGTPIPFDLDDSDSARTNGEVVDYGLGRVRYTGEAARAGGYDGLFRATPTRSVDEFPWGGGFGGGFPTTVLLASDAGVRIPALGSIVLMLLGYTAIAGPVLWVVLRRVRREPLLWLALPAVALVTTGMVYVLGQAIRDETSTAHATLVADLPTQRMVTSQVLVTSPNGGTAGITLDTGWRPAQVTSEQAFFEGPFGAEAQPQAELRGDELALDLPPGGVGVVAGETVLERGTPSWTFDLRPDDGRLVGTVTNQTNHDLEEAFVVSGGGLDRIGAVGAGETADITLRNPSQPPTNGDPFMELAWRSDPFSGDTDGPSNPGVLLDWLSSRPELRLPGFVVIVGWTRDEPGPIATSGGATVDVGRTAYLMADRLDDELIPPGDGRLELLRGWGSTRVTDDVGNACADFPATIRVTPAPSALDGDVVVATSTRAVAGMDIWSGDSWEPVGMADAPPGDVAIGIPRSFLADGTLTLRTQMSCEFWGMADPFPSVRAATGDDEVLAIGALGAGRDTNGVDDDGDGDGAAGSATTEPPAGQPTEPTTTAPAPTTTSAEEG